MSAVIALMLTVTLVAPLPALAAEAPVNLGKTVTFAILAGTTITNTGPTIISGDAGVDVGLHPGTDIPGRALITGGVFHVANAVALDAQNALITAYDDAAGRGPATNISAELGGQVLIPGVYSSTEGFFHLNVNGKLTLDAKGDPNGVFIFQTTSSLIAESGSVVSLINSARYCRVFWKVGSSATLGTGSTFIGHILALTSIWAKTGATIQGQLLARNGEVTLDTNTIINGFCGLSPSPTPPTPIGGATQVATYPPLGGGTISPLSPTNLPPTGDKTADRSTPGILAAGAGLVLILAGISLYVFKRRKTNS